MIARRLAILLSLTLTACSMPRGPNEPVYVPPSPPTEKAIVTDVALAAGEEKLAGPFQISAVRPTEHGPGLYYFCLKQTNPPADIRRTHFAVFANGEEYRGVRSSIMIDECEKQTYSPLPTIAPTAQAPKAKPTTHKAARGKTQ